MKHLFDSVSLYTSKLITKQYSTSFSAGIFFLHKRLHEPLYSIYAYVRLADEIVDSFEGFDKKQLLDDFRRATMSALQQNISTNPVLNSFQKAARSYNIEWELIDTFLNSMEMDLKQNEYTRCDFDQYILGSAEVVGLMCLRVFVENNNELYEELKPAAMKLGAGFQKVNFLRDMQADYQQLGRMYFPNRNFDSFSEKDKVEIEAEIEEDFNIAFEGIKRLPVSSRLGVYLAYRYYVALLKKIKGVTASRIRRQRVRVSNERKFGLMIQSYLQHTFNMI